MRATLLLDAIGGQWHHSVMMVVLSRLWLCGLLIAPAWARAQVGEPARAADFVRQAGAELAGVVAGVASPADKEARLKPYLERVVDEDGVARFCLGHYWQNATPEQRTEYLRLFRLQLLHGVVDRLGSYQAGATKITIDPPVERADGVYVPTVVESAGNKPVNITWLVEVNGSSMQIADVMAEGMSLRVTERNDFGSFLSHHGGNIETLLAVLRKRFEE